MAERAAETPAASATAAAPTLAASASKPVRDVAPGLVPRYAANAASVPADVTENDGSMRPSPRSADESGVKPDKLAAAPAAVAPPPGSAPAPTIANSALPPPLPQVTAVASTAAEENGTTRKQADARSTAIRFKKRHAHARRKEVERQDENQNYADERDDDSHTRAPAYDRDSRERSRELRARRMRERYEARGYRTVEQRVLPDGRRMLVFEPDDADD
jgi:hypothetical protein